MRNSIVIDVVGLLVVTVMVIGVGCGPEAQELHIPMLIIDPTIATVTTSTVRLTWRTNIQAGSQVSYIHVPPEALWVLPTNFTLNDLLDLPGVTASNTRQFSTPTELHDYTIDGLQPGNFYAFILGSSNQLGAKAVTMGWKFLVQTFSAQAGSVTTSP